MYVNGVHACDPRSTCTVLCVGDDDSINVTEYSVARKLREISASRANGPDDVPNFAVLYNVKDR